MNVDGLTSSLTWDDAREALLSMVEEDLRLRSELAADGSLFLGYNPRMRAVHDANAARLSHILDSLGWPGDREVGPDAGAAAWLIVQHAIAQPALQRRALQLVQSAVREGNAPAVHAAMLEDRIRTFEGRPQLYGTQFDWDADGELSPLPIQDPESVDARRREIGLGSLEEAVRKHRSAVAGEHERAPSDWNARSRQMETWCREVGWRV